MNHIKDIGGEYVAGECPFPKRKFINIVRGNIMKIYIKLKDGYQSGQLINNIKNLRTFTGLGLKESTDFIESLMKDNKYTPVNVWAPDGGSTSPQYLETHFSSFSFVETLPTGVCMVSEINSLTAKVSALVLTGHYDAATTLINIIKDLSKFNESL